MRFTTDSNGSDHVPFGKILRSTLVLCFAPIALLTFLVLTKVISANIAFYGMIFIVCITLLILTPYISNLIALTDYVRGISLDKRMKKPDLSFLNNVEELSDAVAQLHESWQDRKRHLESIIAEGKVLVNSLPDILIMLNKDLEVIGTNNKANAIFGGRFFQQTLDDIVNHEDIFQAAEQVLQTGTGQTIPYYLEPPYNKSFQVQIERFPIYSKGNIAIILVMHDVTKQRKTETLLADFVANASHEMRTPLTTLMGFIETLQTVAKDDADAKDKFLGIMQVQADRMAKLIDDLLSLSKIERNAHSQPDTIVEVNNLIEQAIVHLAPKAEEKQMRLGVRIAEDKMHTLGDIGELVQVFENIIGNAVKYGHAGSHITVNAHTTGNTFRDVEELRDYSEVILISVADESDGIPAEHLPRLTERFYRVDTARSRSIGGTGLGLSIVKHILERHRGAMRVSSKIGKGSVFSVLLPYVNKKD